MMDSGNGRMREVMKGVIEHYSEDGRHTKADGIHMFSNFDFRLGLFVLLPIKTFFRLVEMCHLWILRWKCSLHQNNKSHWEIYSFGSAACKVICKAGLTLHRVIFIKVCQANVSKSADETRYGLSIFHHVLNVME